MLPLSLPIAMLLCLATVACGASHNADPSATAPASSSSTAATASTRTTPTSPVYKAAPAGDYLKDDGDKDGDDGHPGVGAGDDKPLLAEYGPTAPHAERTAIASLVKRYYSDLTRGDAHAACALLTTGVATGLAESPGHSHGADCAGALSSLLVQQREHLRAEDVASMLVIDARVKGELGLVEIGFRASPTGQIQIEREGGAWKLAALFDSEMP